MGRMRDEMGLAQTRFHSNGTHTSLLGEIEWGRSERGAVSGSRVMCKRQERHIIKLSAHDLKNKAKRIYLSYRD